MTANDFFLLFTAFGGFVIAPTLLLWGIGMIARRNQKGTRGPDVRPDVHSSGPSRDHGRKETARSEKALRRLVSCGDACRA